MGQAWRGLGIKISPERGGSGMEGLGDQSPLGSQEMGGSGMEVPGGMGSGAISDSSELMIKPQCLKIKIYLK